jgi:hypothetical protein
MFWEVALEEQGRWNNNIKIAVICSKFNELKLNMSPKYDKFTH